MPLLTVIAKITAKKEAVEKVAKQLTNLVPPTRKEQGCVQYSLYQDNDDPAVLMVYERWESKNDLDAHMNTKHFKECFAEIEGLFHIEVHLLTEKS
jgi:quinol monooxygenase YgiN